MGHMAVDATYSTMWDNGVTVTTRCRFDRASMRCFDIEGADVDGVEVLEDEYVTLADGTELRAADGVDFEY
jgi:hypothetical protein